MADFRALCLFIALLTGTEVPGGIASRFPTLPGDGRNAGSHVLRPADELSHVTGEGEDVSGSQPREEYLRVVVNAWNDDCIYCTDDLSGMELRVCYSAGGLPNKGSDHSYIRDLLYKGVMLNLIRPRTMAGGMLYPEFIILDPDYLVDVSTIVSCFDTYAESPLLALIKRLEPFRPTEPILLGNMAGELLDEVLHARDIPSALPLATRLQDAYRRTAGTFFRRHAMSIMCLQPSSDFHRNAWQQFMNIRSAMLRTLPQQVPGYDPQHVVVEPTFFSEMLGLQGRMDMLQRDMRVLVEQKSGKGGFTPGHDDAATPVHTEQHYMQMLLYMAIIRYNFRRAYDASGGQLYALPALQQVCPSAHRPGLCATATLCRTEDAQCLCGPGKKHDPWGHAFCHANAGRGLQSERGHRPPVARLSAAEDRAHTGPVPYGHTVGNGIF